MSRDTMQRFARPALVAGLVLLLGAPAAAAEATEGPAKVGAAAPDFTLIDTDGEEHSLSAYLEQGKTVVLEWFNPDCPFIKKHHLEHRTMNETYARVKDRDVVWLAVNSGAPGKQGHGLLRNRQARQEYAMPFPILLDETGEVGRLYGARTTPHMFVIGADGVLVYSGAIDDDRSPSRLGATNHVAAALARHLAGEKVGTPETSPYGCSVKYAAP